MSLLSLRQDDFSYSTRIVLGLTLRFLYLKDSDFFTQIQQKQARQTPVMAGFRHTMHRLPENMFLLTLRQVLFSN